MTDTPKKLTEWYQVTVVSKDNEVDSMVRFTEREARECAEQHTRDGKTLAAMIHVEIIDGKPVGKVIY